MNAARPPFFNTRFSSKALSRFAWLKSTHEILIYGFWFSPSILLIQTDSWHQGSLFQGREMMGQNDQKKKKIAHHILWFLHSKSLSHTHTHTCMNTVVCGFFSGFWGKDAMEKQSLEKLSRVETWGERISSSLTTTQLPRLERRKGSTAERLQVSEDPCTGKIVGPREEGLHGVPLLAKSLSPWGVLQGSRKISTPQLMLQKQQSEQGSGAEWEFSWVREK